MGLFYAKMIKIPPGTPKTIADLSHGGGFSLRVGSIVATLSFGK